MQCSLWFGFEQLKSLKTIFSPLFLRDRWLPSCPQASLMELVASPGRSLGSAVAFPACCDGRRCVPLLRPPPSSSAWLVTEAVCVFPWLRTSWQPPQRTRGASWQALGSGRQLRPLQNGTQLSFLVACPHLALPPHCFCRLGTIIFHSSPRFFPVLTSSGLP